MNLREITEKMAEKTGTSKAQAKAAINAFTGIVAEAMAENEPVKIEGFGTFLVKQRAGHIGRNPMHPEKTVKIPPHRHPVFRASRNLKKSINSRESCTGEQNPKTVPDE